MLIKRLKWQWLVSSLLGYLIIPSCGDPKPITTETRQKGEDCDTVNLCIKGLICESGKCRVLCNSNSDCGPKEHCENNRCVTNLNDKCPDGFTGNNCDQCLPGYYGPDCLKCNCENGTCKDTLLGNGSCICKTGWDGETCNKCASGFEGKNCDKCQKGYYGTQCEQCNCGEHGVCDAFLIKA